MGAVFVHAQRGGQGAAACDGDARQLQEPLEGAVLAVAAVEHRESHVQRDALDAAFLQQQQAVIAAVGGQDSGDAVRRVLPGIAEQLLHRAGVMEPLAVLGDANQHGTILFAVQVQDDA